MDGGWGKRGRNGGGELAAQEDQRAREIIPKSFEEIMGNQLLAEQILSSLSFHTLKVLATVSTGTYHAVRGSTRFRQHATVHISTENDLLLWDPLHFRWGPVSVDLTVSAPPPAITVGLENVMKGVASLNLYFDTAFQALEDAQAYRYLNQLLRLAVTTANPDGRKVNLKRLGLHASVFARKPNFTFDAEVEEVLRRLDHFEILGTRNSPEATVIEGEGWGLMPFSNCLQQLKTLRVNKCLKYTVKNILRDNMLSIVGSNMNTLQELELHSYVWNCSEMADIQCPSLKRLSLSATGCVAARQIVGSFTSLQPALEELTVSMGICFPIEILLKLIALNKVHKLKKLHLGSRYFGHLNGQRVQLHMEEYVRWMPQLRDFSLYNHYGVFSSSQDMRDNFVGEDILRSLPTNMEKISLQHIPAFWNHPQMDMLDIGLLLAPFRNLKELHLDFSLGAVTNDGLQTLVTSCRSLKCLSFDCRSKDDVLRRNVDWEAISLNPLTNLIDLRIIDVMENDHRPLFRELQIEGLKTFHYVKKSAPLTPVNVNDMVSREVLLQIVRRNTSLETVMLEPFRLPGNLTPPAREIFQREITAEVNRLNPSVKVVKLQ